MKKTITIALIAVMLFTKVTPGIVVAQSAPSAPTAPSAPEAPSAPNAPTYNEKEEKEDEREWDRERDRDRNRDRDREQNNDNEENQNNTEENTSPEETSSQTTQSNQEGTTPTGVVDSGNVGDTTITTGNTSSSGSISNTGNLNTSAGTSGSGGGATVKNSGNGTGSANSGSVTTTSTDNTTQTNGAVIKNDLNQEAVSGSNEASRNVGGNSSIATGDANVTGTIINSVNTNVDGVAVAEFNVVDDHRGDIILDFGDIHCVAGCTNSNNTINVENTDNGSDSENTGEITNINTDNTFQSNDATIENNMTLVANTGDNSASKNVGGDSIITTGDANISANVVNFVNNNIAGNVIFGVVNIFGELVGDIILPDNPFASCTSCTSNNISAANTLNGDGSDNNVNITDITNDNTLQFNEAYIDNNIIIDANTGENSASRNTGGSSSITTGNTDVDVQTLNIANSNINGGDWWLVIVNEAGKWIGKIMGAPEGQNFAGSYGTEFTVGEDGEITAVNSENGPDSTNNATVTNSNNSTTTQVNDAHIVNNLDLTANTGSNSTNSNTGGNNSITTGDVNIVASIVNFVNNNIAGDGRLFVTMVNVFGSWMGDLVTPGQKKENKTQTAHNNTPAVGGQENNSNSAESSNTSENKTEKKSTTSNETTDITTESEDKENTIKVAFKGVFGTKDTNINDINEKTTIKSNGAPQLVQSESKDVIRINLAWLVLALPLIAAGLGTYKLTRKIRSRKNYANTI